MSKKWRDCHFKVHIQLITRPWGFFWRQDRHSSWCYVWCSYTFQHLCAFYHADIAFLPTSQCCIKLTISCIFVIRWHNQMKVWMQFPKPWKHARIVRNFMDQVPTFYAISILVHVAANRLHQTLKSSIPGIYSGRLNRINDVDTSDLEFFWSCCGEYGVANVLLNLTLSNFAISNRT